MISSFIQGYMRIAPTSMNLLQLAFHTVPMMPPELELLRQPYKAVTDQAFLERWGHFITKYPAESRAVQLVHGAIPTTSGALGNTFFNNSPKIMALDVGLECIDPDAALFFCKHEFAHLKHNDGLIHFSALLVANLAALYFSTAWYVPIACGVMNSSLAEKTLGKRAECRADTFAFGECTEDELRGAVRFFEASRQVEHEICSRNSCLKRVVRALSSFFVRHPKDSERMEKAAESLRLRFNYDQSALTAIKADARVSRLKKYIEFRATTPSSDPQYKEKFIRCI